MKIAITGASGFLGRYLAREFAAAGHECRGLIRPDSPRFQTKPILDEWTLGSLDDGESLRALVEGTDALVHAALDHPGGGFLKGNIDVASFVERNVVGTIRLIEAAKASNVGRIVIISSGAVHDIILDDRSLDEAHPLWPKTHYGATKAAIEAFVHSYGKGEGLQIAALRPTSIYGIAEPIEQSRWYDLIAAVTRGEPVECHKGGKQVHAADVTRAALLLLTTPEPIAGEVYHCTDRFIAERDVAEFSQSIAKSTGKIDGEIPKSRHPIDCGKLKDLGLTFGGESLLHSTIEAMVRTIRAGHSATASS